eukprot:TRINITY_DN1280_c0_g1_i3.p1 TRINITY_DN1280_c0_g1~~TRINITY_DN1280_c0_g1_i3.p1  ORF type:complete len:458 (-),score=95.08 TRINITY_DN1280_c0_g1_i3:551-1924(-)
MVEEADIENAINYSFIMITTVFVFYMQLGFAFLEAGSVRSKNTVGILLKNVIDMMIGVISFWCLGYGFAYGESAKGILGTSGFFLINIDLKEYVEFFHQVGFAATTATILSGAMAERTKLYGYILYTFMQSAFVYPVVAHWVWNENGWLNNMDYIDYAGSSVVHFSGGVGALFGTIIVGPRIGKFQNSKINIIPGHSTVLTMLGGLFLWFGFFSFNLSSIGNLFDNNFDYSLNELGRSLVNTMLSGGVSGVTTLLLKKYIFSIKIGNNKDDDDDNSKFNVEFGRFSLNSTINGIIIGCVSICASAHMVAPWSAFIIGVLASFTYVGFSRLSLELRIDDPVNAIAIHMFGGALGIIFPSIFGIPNVDRRLPDGGILYAWNLKAFVSLGTQIMGCAVIFVWVGLFCLFLFLILKQIGLLRVSPQIEEEGLDQSENELAYPLDFEKFKSLFEESDTNLTF